jgi:polyvinyl alcohol dehydrogenase (cytochrome)
MKNIWRRGNIWSGSSILAIAAFVQCTFGQPPTGQQVNRASEGDGSTIFGNYCENCHGKVEEAPQPATLKQMPPERIYKALTTGDMRGEAQTAHLTDQQMRDIAEWVGGRKIRAGGEDDASNMPNACASKDPITAEEFTSLPAWNGWSNDLFNHRFQPAKAAVLSPAAVERLRLKWAFALPSAASVYGQPTVVAGRVFVSGDSGYVYALNASTGCVYWSFQAQAGVASAITIEPKPGSRGQYLAYFGDIHGNVYSVDTRNGELVWKTLVDQHPLARIRGAMKYYNGRLYVPVASLEEPESSSPNYACCSFRGLVTSLDAATGKQIWKTYMIDEQPTPRKTSDGKSFIGPSGAGVWGPTMVDPKRKAIYVSTGNASSAPETGRSDALVALDMDTGKILWVHQDEAGDVWHTGCPQGPPPPGEGFPPKSAGRSPSAGRGPAGGRGGAGAGRGRPQMPATYYCPEEKNDPDWDFAAGVMLADLPNGKSLLIAGQKSGMVWAHDPDAKGALVWKSDVSRGQIVFGGAADDENAYFAMRGGAVVAVRLSDGVERWSTPIPPQESMSMHRGNTAAVTVIPGVLFAPGLDGMLRAFSTFDGRPLWAYDTTAEVKTVNGLTAKGGSIGSAGATVAGGMLFVTSGYTGFQSGQPGNLLLAFGPPTQ